MPRFEPFPALRYAQDDLQPVIAPPYDVLSDADVDALEGRHAHNIVHVDVPRERDGDGRYDAAGTRLREWIAESVLVRDAEPSFTLYRMEFVDAAGRERSIVGVLGGLEVVDAGAGRVLPHERTTKKASTDRLDLTRATSANLSPVWGLSLAGGLTELLTEPGEPMGSVTFDGVTHTVERVTDEARVAAISAMVWSDDVLIADGHHRYGVAREYRDEIRSSSGSDDTDAELTLVFVSELVADQLSVEAIHRVYRDIDRDGLVAALSAGFEMEPAGPVTARRSPPWTSAARCACSTATAAAPGSRRSPGRSTRFVRWTEPGSSTSSTARRPRSRTSTASTSCTRSCPPTSR